MKFWDSLDHMNLCRAKTFYVKPQKQLDLGTFGLQKPLNFQKSLEPFKPLEPQIPLRPQKFSGSQDQKLSQLQDY